jgi:predicted Zn-dependent protease
MAYGVGAKLGAELPHSRAQESEADRIGLIYMAQAGYAPEAAVDFWKRFGEFNKQQGSETPWFLRTHPLDETRVKQLQGWIPEAKAKANAPK